MDYRRAKNRTSIDGLPAFDDDGPARLSVRTNEHGQPVGDNVPGWTLPRPAPEPASCSKVVGCASSR